MSNFVFLQAAFAELAESAQEAEKLVYVSPQASLMFARHSLETLVYWLYKYDNKLILPYDSKLSNLLTAREFVKHIPMAIRTKMNVVRMVGNQAVHGSKGKRTDSVDAIRNMQELFLIYVWFERTYGDTTVDRSQQPVFAADKIPNLEKDAVNTSQAQLQKMQQQFEAEQAGKHAVLKELQDSITQYSSDAIEQNRRLAELNAELAQLRAQVAEAKQHNQAILDTYDYHEAETRARLIDVLLAEAGWTLHEDARVEVAVEGMPNQQGEGFVDYVLYGANGLPLAVVEAKRSMNSPVIGQQQAKLYADCLEQMTGQRPVIFYTNGYQTYLWNDANGGGPRTVAGFYTQAELQRLIERRSNQVVLNDVAVNADIVGRYYQVRAIKALQAAFTDKQRKGLLIMATGTGKTRTAIALVDVLMKANWIQKVLFLADRTSLVNQATNAFKEHLPDCAAVNLVTTKNQVGRVYLSTYQTMMGLIDQMNEDGTRKFGIGMFDLIIIDEAHRSVYQKYGEIFNYFDGLLVGLTATPRDEVDRSTYELFNLENGVPTDLYPLDIAIQDRYLVPPKNHSVPLKFMREGVKYDELNDDEKDHWEGLDWGDEETPNEISASSMNKKLFNQDTVDKMLKHLMEHGLKVQGGDLLGKTIIFAVNQNHAEFIAQRFDANYPQYDGKFARVITHATKYAQSLIDDFSKKDSSEPQIAISVDMLDTGIDVPEVLNLVFFKAVRSKIKFMQMIGRGTRLCEDLFAPGHHKSEFYIFDYCCNFEYFNENPAGVDTTSVEPISQRLFKARLNILGMLSSDANQTHVENQAVALDIRNGLHAEVKSMNKDNFIVRTELEHIERFEQAENWHHLDDLALGVLRERISKLPSQQEPEPLETKLFDLLCLNLELAVLQNSNNAVEAYKARVMEIASKLEAMDNIPVIAAQMVLIQEILTEAYWQDITLSLMESMRKRIRTLVPLIEKVSAKVVYSMLEDELGEMEEVSLPDIATGVNLAQYRKKVESFIKANESHLTIAKLKNGMQLTPTDLQELERFVYESQVVESQDRFKECFGAETTLIQFIRSLVGLNREAVQKAFSKYLMNTQYDATQVRFIEMIIEHLTKNGMMEVSQLYDAPFNQLHFEGVDGVFGEREADQIATIVEELSAA